MANDLSVDKATPGGAAAASSASAAPASARPPSLSVSSSLPPTSPSSRRGKPPASAVPPAVEAAIAADRRRTQSAGDLRTFQSLSFKLQDPPSPSSGAQNRSNSLLAMGSSFLATLTASSPSSPRRTAGGSAIVVEVVYPDPGPLFVDLVSRADGKGAYIKSFRRKPDGTMGNAEADGRVKQDDELFAINGRPVTDFAFGDIIQAAKCAVFPLTLTFHCVSDKEEGLPRRHSGSLQPSPASSDREVTEANASASSTSPMNRSTVQRSNSFDNKKGETVNGAPSPSTTSVPNSPSRGAFRAPWGDGISLDKVRNTGADGMKTLFRKIGAGGKSRPEEDRETVHGWLENLALKPQKSGGNGPRGRISVRKPEIPAVPQDILHTTPIVSVTTGGRFVGVLEEDEHEFELTWYRKMPPPASDVLQIKGVRRSPYFPSADDIGATISLQVRSLRFPQLSKVVELPQPLVLDPAVGEMVDVMLETGAGAFSATLASNEFDSFQIKIMSEGVTLVKISEHEDEAGVVVNVAYTEHVQVLFDPTDQLRFILKVQEFGPFLGNRQGDTCNMKKKEALRALSCFFLVAQNPQHRDILALLIRRFRARTIDPEVDERAQSDERNRFVDPAFDDSVDLSGSSTGAARASDLGSLHSASSGENASIQSGSVGTPGGAHGSSSLLKNGSSMPSPTKQLPGTPHMPLVDKAGSFRSLTDMSSPSLSDRLGDMFGLDLDDLPANAKSAGSTPVGTPLNGKNSNDAPAQAASDPFLQGRVVSQEKEIQALKEKLVAMSVLLKSVDQEKTQFGASLEVKDKRIELQHMKLRQLEKVASQYAAQTRDMQQLRAKLDEEARKQLAYQYELEQARASVAERVANVCEQETQTEEHLFSSADAGQYDAFFGVATVSVDDLQRRIEAQDTALARLEEERDAAIAERNSLRQKSTELSKELKKLLGVNRSLADIEQQLIERANLAMEVAVTKAELKRASDETQEYKEALEALQRQRGSGDKDKDRQRILNDNKELQRTVHELTDSVNESREQLVATKAINAALVQKLQELQPDARGSLFESPMGSPQSVQSAQLEPTFSDDDDDEDEEEKEEHREGIAAFRRSLA